MIKHPFFAERGLKDAISLMASAARLFILPLFPGNGMVAVAARKAVFFLVNLMIKKNVFLARGL